MTAVQQTLYDEVSKLPLEKVGKAISFIRFLESEPEPELILTAEEEAELDAIIDSGDFIDADSVLAMIEAMPDD